MSILSKKSINIRIRIPVSQILLPYLVLEKLRDRYMSMKDFNSLMSTCREYRGYYSTKMNVYWFEKYTFYHKYQEKNAKNRKHVDRVYNSCATSISKRAIKMIQYKNWEMTQFIHEFRKQSRKGIEKSYSLDDLVKVVNSKQKAKVFHKLLGDLCTHDHHINFNCSRKDYDKNRNYFFKFMNGKQEISSIINSKAKLELAQELVDHTKHEIRAMKKNIDELQKRLATYEKNIGKYEKNVETQTQALKKLAELTWDSELFTTIQERNPELFDNKKKTKGIHNFLP